MNVSLIFFWVYLAMFAMSFWESYSEGRNSWDKGKLGWKIKIGKKFVFSGYHFFIFVIMWPVMISLPLVVNGWDTRLFGVLASAYFSGMIVQDFGWYVVNPEVKLREFWTEFSDYYPWIRIGKKKIIPTGYVASLVVAFLSWAIFWR